MNSGSQELIRQLEECRKECSYYKREYLRAKDNAVSERISKNETLDKLNKLRELK